MPLKAQLQQAFSGVKCSGNVFAGGGAGDIQVYLREPLSGTMNTTEYTVFRYPDFSGNSQETGVAGHNPLNGLACGTGVPSLGVPCRKIQSSLYSHRQANSVPHL